jgi:hypothetical protein
MPEGKECTYHDRVDCNPMVDCQLLQLYQQSVLLTCQPRTAVLPTSAMSLPSESMSHCDVILRNEQTMMDNIEFIRNVEQDKTMLHMAARV